MLNKISADSQDGRTMARHQRISPQGVSQHVIQRGNNRSPCFHDEKDFIAYTGWLKKYSAKFGVDIHAWVLMTNHVHLLCTPRLDNQGISKMMQSLGRMYVRFFNYKYQRTGTLWEGRFRSSLVNSEAYLLRLQQYIELNPVRANMVQSPHRYKWSSFAMNGLGKSSSLYTAHPVYLSLGETKGSRLLAYQSLFKQPLKADLLAEIRSCSQRELVLGDSAFISQVEALTNTKLKAAKMGRPFKNNGL